MTTPQPRSPMRPKPRSLPRQAPGHFPILGGSLLAEEVDPEGPLERRVCLDEVSKNLRGQLYLLEAEHQRCEERECVTLKTEHVLKAEVEAHEPCDSEHGRAFDGAFMIRELVTAFAYGDGYSRGVHEGRFRWRGQALVVEGAVQGVTNAGTHRPPVFDECQQCKAPGFMEGRFSGRVIRAEQSSLQGCDVLGAYRFRFDPSKAGGEGQIDGALEGVCVCECESERPPNCTDFGTFTPSDQPNPWTVQGRTYAVYDHNTALERNIEVVSWNGHIGLNCSWRTDVSLPVPVSQIEVTMMHGNVPATVEALSGGSVVASGTMTRTRARPDTVVLSGPQIDTAIIHAPENETLLLQLCTK